MAEVCSGKMGEGAAINLPESVCGEVEEDRGRRKGEREREGGRIERKRGGGEGEGGEWRVEGVKGGKLRERE